ncbi:MAG: hypothetical protein E6R05_06805 [Candidatus Moraniibacteriota bacterium]|nr:MAG: hypothetical protein E6R05_06805 [Candidatus Moranbacteria bacterium]
MKFKIKSFHSTNVLFTIFTLGIVAILWTFFSQFGLGESGYNFLGKTKKIALSPAKPVTQIFTAHEDNLNQIRFVLGNADIWPTDQLSFELLDQDCQQTLRSATFRHKPLQQGTYTVFSFDPITDSKNQRYCFQAIFTSPSNRKGEKPYLSATQASSPLFADRILTDTNKNKVYPAQTIFLRPAYTQGSVLKNLAALENRLSQYKPLWIKEKILLLGIIWILFSIALGYMISRERETPEDHHPRKK